MTVHSIALLGTADPADGAIATDAAAFYSFLQPPCLGARRGTSESDKATESSPPPPSLPTFTLFAASELAAYDGAHGGFFTVGDTFPNRRMVSIPRDRDGSGSVQVVQPPSALKAQFLQCLEERARVLQKTERLLVAFFARSEESSDDIILGGGAGNTVELLSPKEIHDILRQTGNENLKNVSLWNSSGFRDRWISQDFVWTVLTPAAKQGGREKQASDHQPSKSDNPPTLPKPFLKYGASGAEGKVSRAWFRKLLASTNPSDLAYPLDFLTYGVDSIFDLPGGWAPWQSNVNRRICTASTAGDVNALGDIFASRMQCVLTIYLYCVCGPWRIEKPEEYATLEHAPEKLHAFILGEAAMVESATLRAFMKMFLTGYLHAATDVGPVVHGLPVKWTDVLRWMAGKWVQAGRPHFDARSVLFVRAWRFSKLRVSFDAIVQFLADVWDGDDSFESFLESLEAAALRIGI